MFVECNPVCSQVLDFYPAKFFSPIGGSISKCERYAIDVSES